MSMTMGTVSIPMTVSVSQVSLPMSAEGSGGALSVSIGSAYSMESNAHYEGGYSFTPSQETQTIPTAGLVVDENITINPIPNNYGLITWNGSYLTVS